LTKIEIDEHGIEFLFQLWGFRRGDKLESIGLCTDPVIRAEIIANALARIHK
jgi:hypothetical protein